MAAPDYTRGTLRDVIPGCLGVLGVSGMPDRLGLAERLDGVRRIVVLLVDGMGWHQLPLMAPHAPLIGSLSGTKTTTGFPSTTPTSLISLTTGAMPGEHGVLAFTSRVPGTDQVLNHGMWRDDPPPALWQPIPPLFIRAAAEGINVAVVNRGEYVGSGLSISTTSGARYVPADDIDSMVDGIAAELTGDAPALIYAYHPSLDRAGHGYGLDSPQWRLAASDVDKMLDRIVGALPPDAALIVTADHGQLNVPADRRIDIDADARLGAGVQIVAGEPRVRYLHTAPGATEDVLAAWREVAGHAAWIGSREEAIATGWYGAFNPDFAERLGDVVVVCHDDWAVLATGRERPSIATLVAMHGALTDVEMDIPLLVVTGR